MFRRSEKTAPLGWRGLARLAAVTLSVSTAGSSLAASPQCRQLEAELARLSRSSGDVTLSDAFAEAAEAQRDQIDLARARSSEFGCGRAVSGAMIAECAKLNAKIAEMEDNLGSLNRGQTGKNAQRERIRILDALELSGCNDQEPGDEGSVATAPAAEAPDAQPNGTIIRGGSSQNLVPNDSYSQHIVIEPEFGQATGDYRTLCVRTCDGYFFPMSNAASLSDFQRDQKSCEAGCPGTEIELFYHLSVGETQDNMVSARTGQPYNKLPTAFRFKRVDLPRQTACGCKVGQKRDFSILAGDGRAVPGVTDTKPAADAPAAPTRPVPDPDRKVRAVGPTFLPDPGEAIDLRVPAPTRAP